MISDDGRSKKSENPFITFHHIGYIDQTRIQAPLRASWCRKLKIWFVPPNDPKITLEITLKITLDQSMF